MTNEIIESSNRIQVVPERVTKSGRTLKPVFANWNGDALITQSGRLVRKKQLGVILSKSGKELTSAYEKANERFQFLGVHQMTEEQGKVKTGSRQIVRWETKDNGNTIIEIRDADASAKMRKRLAVSVNPTTGKNYSKEEIDAIVSAALKAD